MDFDLEELVNVEETFYNEGYKDGFAHGRIHGLIEGRALGREKGFEMWEELGFYEGFAATWKAIYDKRGIEDDRAINHIKHLQDLIAQFPKANPSASEPSELDIPKLFRQIRSRHKALCATLGVRVTYGMEPAAPPSASDDDPPVSLEPGKSGGKKKVWTLDNPSPSAGEKMSF
ncbi:hypothetical protein BXZ70DRAFT_508147 [Cristinia sonorae]|uniref:Essential protein Yae1 N-terminal domain-containing protein n=1 Tax=Cristinia sonorae TaxID=1940300 RepID=A0A8K0XTE2_9AGAR|nr:hypothetical protein BXZ70DRAFT_508147 [Cristinia sonorae]